MNNTNLTFTLEFLENMEDHAIYVDAELLLQKCTITPLWQDQNQACFDVDTEEESQEIILYFEKEADEDWLSILVDRDDPEYIVACYMMYRDTHDEEQPTNIKGKIYKRSGIIKRVLKERRKKARKLNHRVKLNKNLYDEHLLLAEDRTILKVTIWDLKNQLGYIDNIDWKTNKLATTKHIMYLCDYIDETPSRYKRLRKTKSLIELTLDPQKDYQLTWIYNPSIPDEHRPTIESIFGVEKTHLTPEELVDNHQPLMELAVDPNFVIRSEVFEKISRYFDKKELEDKRLPMEEIDFSEVNASLYPYQKEGAYFSLFRQSTIIADEMGLGKTIQAITIALLKKRYLGFRKTLIICPASVKYQWAAEIEKFSNEQVLVVSGKVKDRGQQYIESDAFFIIANYELVMRDYNAINEAGFDLIVLDEAQRIKNFNTKTASVMQDLHKQHGLVLTGTPIENKLIDIYAIILFLDKYELTPLWEFSYQHCVFDHESEEKINGYFNLNRLKDRLKDIVIRRQREEVMPQLPNISEKKYLIKLHPQQRTIHASLKRKIAGILAKKFKTKFDWDQIMMALTQMRRVSNSTYLLRKDTSHSSKIDELKYILKYQLDIKNTNRKIIVFSEWLDSLYLIERVLDDIGIKYTKLTGSIPTAKRGKIVDVFMNDEECKVFLSTEAGGAGLNLQVADTVINFELPWNPAKKNQRIGRMNRIGQKNKNLLVIDLICQDSIELRIASGLALKQNLFEGVLNVDNEIDTVDFTEKGRAQFMHELKAYVNEEVMDPMRPNVDDFEDSFNDPEVGTDELFDLENIEIYHDALADDLDWDTYMNDVFGDEEEDIFVEGQQPQEKQEGMEGGEYPLVASESKNGIPQNSEQNPASDSGSNSVNQDETDSKTETEQMEEVLNKGIDFLAGLYQMSTGKKMMDESNEKNISIDKETGEVVLRFKLK